MKTHDYITTRDEAIEQLIEAKIDYRAGDPEWRDVVKAGDRLAAALDAVLELKPR